MIDHLIKRGSFDTTDTYLVENLCRYAQMARENRAQAELAETPTERIAWQRQSQMLDRDVLNIGKRLGMDPIARQRLPQLDKPRHVTPAARLAKGIGAAPSQKLRKVG